MQNTLCLAVTALPILWGHTCRPGSAVHVCLNCVSARLAPEPSIWSPGSRQTSQCRCFTHALLVRLIQSDCVAALFAEACQLTCNKRQRPSSRLWNFFLITPLSSPTASFCFVSQATPNQLNPLCPLPKSMLQTECLPVLCIFLCSKSVALVHGYRV